MDVSPEDTIRADLCHQLMSGKITGKTFVAAIEALDQRTLERVDAEPNLLLLTSPQIITYFDDHQEFQREYQDLLSLTHWHVGQDCAPSYEYERALYHFRKAHSCSLSAGADRHRAWRNYISASISYLEEDLQAVEHFYALLPDDDRNRPIISNFVARLKAGGRPDYKTDYSS